MLRLELSFPGLTLLFYPPQDPPPVGAALAFPWLASLSGINEMASASIVEHVATGETASLTVALENRDNQATDLLGLPLRVPAQLYDGDTLLFAGIIARVQPDLEYTIQIEA